jgi:ActR/RegA family two-component response regulator
METKKRVVIGTDSEHFARDVLGRVNEHGGWDAQIAYDAQEMREMIEMFEPDFVLMDSRAGDSSTYVLMKNLHKDFPTMRLAMFSYEAMTREGAALYLACGAIGCLNFKHNAEAYTKGLDALLDGKD